MAKSNLLNTRTTNFLELIGNGRVYRVPPYQRDYSWEEEQWEDLWHDLLDLRGRPDDRHYMGSLVVEGKSDREFAIIDGQQRLATLSILALAVISRLGNLSAKGVDASANQQRADALRGRFIGEKDPASLVESSKLVLNATDDGFYQDYLVQLRMPLNPKRLPRSNRLLWDCFEFFRRRIEGEPALCDAGASLAELLSETVARQLLFILITVDDELNAYTVFETLNARGLELSTTDLLKNYLFSRLSARSDLDALQRRWQRLITTVRQERFREFLRYHLLCEYPRIRSQRLFKLVQEKARTSQQVLSLMDALEGRAELFLALSDASHTYWIERPECRPFVVELNLFRVRQMTPLLFAAWERFPDDFARVLKLVSVVSFRYTIVCRHNTNDLEPVYHSAAKAVLDGTAQGASTVFDRLRSIYVDDDRFERDFAGLSFETQGTSKKIARYVLARLESDHSKRACDAETDPFTIEHVLPENPANEWAESIPEDRWPSVVYRIGNLTPIESSLNRLIGQATFAEKVTAYARSKYELTRSLAAEPPPQGWTLAALDQRQRLLAGRAVHLWRSDFA